MLQIKVDKAQPIVAGDFVDALGECMEFAL
jgi:hypothetical protein